MQCSSPLKQKLRPATGHAISQTPRMGVWLGLKNIMLASSPEKLIENLDNGSSTCASSWSFEVRCQYALLDARRSKYASAIHSARCQHDAVNQKSGPKHTIDSGPLQNLLSQHCGHGERPMVRLPSPETLD